jgi:serine protease Do
VLGGCSTTGSGPSAGGSTSASAGQSPSVSPSPFSGASAPSGVPGASVSSSPPPSAVDAANGNPNASCPQSSVPDVVAKTEPSVVTVRTQSGLGSGIVFRKNIILTDQHVVAQQEGQPQVVSQVRVELADGSTTSGTVIGSDLLTDLAVIRVGRNDLPPLQFSSTLPRQGETVLALGSPLGFSSSVTEGIVSALGRDLPGSESSLPLVDLIQTDAPISPGNSGGALLDTCGQVVGVNEAYISPQSGAVSLGFATPSVVATDIANQLIATGTAQHPYVGVRVTDLTPSIAQSLGTRAKSGLVVGAVVQGSPAAKAGIRAGDVITELDGKKVGTYAELLGVLRTLKPGNTVPVSLDRRGAPMTLRVTIGSRSSQG